MAEEKAERFITVDRALQTFGGVLLVIVSGIAGWELLKIFDHEGRIIRMETKQEAADANSAEIKKNLKELNDKLDALLQRKP
ncbi:MAG: hypothetical protein KIS92_00900 [Planctomycetota bacterium]|nr:hypothetical protein [Planctomycetota bacterium]